MGENRGSASVSRAWGSVMVNLCIINRFGLLFINGMCIRVTEASLENCATQLMINRALE